LPDNRHRILTQVGLAIGAAAAAMWLIPLIGGLLSADEQRGEEEAVPQRRAVDRLAPSHGQG